MYQPLCIEQLHVLVVVYEGYLKKILEANASVNFYMFHGGTNFGFMNGANKEDQKYKPDVSNYGKTG